MKKYLIVRNIINTLVIDFCRNVTKNIEIYKIQSVKNVRGCNIKIGSFSKELEEKQSGLRRFLHQNMYNHHRVRRMEFKAEMYLQRLFEAYSRKPELLPMSVMNNRQNEKKERLICDYISGMTDRYAINQFKSLFGTEESL